MGLNRLSTFSMEPGFTPPCDDALDRCVFQHIEEPRRKCREPDAVACRQVRKLDRCDKKHFMARLLQTQRKRNVRLYVAARAKRMDGDSHAFGSGGVVAGMVALRGLFEVPGVVKRGRDRDRQSNRNFRLVAGDTLGPL